MTRELIDRAEALAFVRDPQARADIAALPAVTVGVGVEPLRYVEPHGETIEQMRDHARQQSLARDGDMVLVWVNEGDLYEHAFPLAALDLNPAPVQPQMVTEGIDLSEGPTRHVFSPVTQPDPAAIREAALREAAAIATKAEEDWWRDYKNIHSPHAYSPHREGMSDGATDIADRILALIQKEPTDDSA